MVDKLAVKNTGAYSALMNDYLKRNGIQEIDVPKNASST